MKHIINSAKAISIATLLLLGVGTFELACFGTVVFISSFPLYISIPTIFIALILFGAFISWLADKF